ncbi:MAG: diguanylate cyclase [Candidatus Omnitrophica bacterium]|nr:diguanylate cyclase [Candidatus Omnitrophota bacterium]
MKKNDVKYDWIENIAKLVLDGVGMGISIISPQMRILWLNKKYRAAFPDIKIDQHPLCYKSFYAPPKKKICSYCPTIKAFKTGKTQRVETDKCIDGKYYNLIATPIKNKQGKVDYVIETLEDITLHKYTESALRTLESQYYTTLASMNDAIHVIDTNYRIVLFNAYFKKWCKQLGVSGEAIGRNVFDVFPFLDVKVREEYKKVFESGKALITYETNRVKNKEVITETRKIPVSENNKITGIITIVRDMTEAKKAEKNLEMLNKKLTESNKKLNQMALRDSDTGLYNHRYLSEVIEAEFFRAKRYGHSLSTIMLDIDYFKSINNVYGHNFGDLVLKQLAYQLRKLVRQYDIVIRYAGEEFIIISPGTDRNTAIILAQRILDAIGLFNFGNKQHSVKLKLSFAVASYPEDRILNGMDLVEISDKILDNVKQRGGNKVFSTLDIEKTKPAEEAAESGDVQSLKEKVSRLTRQASQSIVESILAFAKTLELKDHYTGEHVEKTVQFAVNLAKALELPDDEVERIRQAAILHDLGKVGISEKILCKKGKLTTKEFEIIKTHTQIAVDILRPIQVLQGIIPLVLYHHERWDGKGYPHGLKGEEIPLGARVVALADVYQALISDRPYRKAYPKPEVIKIIRAGAGSQFDPHIVGVFLKIVQK